MKKTALVLIDIQRDYFAGGACQLPGATAALKCAAELLQAARHSGLDVVHVQQRTPPEMGLPLMVRGTAGEEIHEAVCPLPGELVIEKKFPSAFQQTGLQAELAARNIGSLLVAGMMTHLCVASTVHSAFERGFRVVLAADATATCDLTGSWPVSAATLQQAQLAALSGVFATVEGSHECIHRELHGR